MYDKSLGQALGYGQSFVPGRLGRRVRPVGVDVQTPQTPALGAAPAPIAPVGPVAAPAPAIQKGGPLRRGAQKLKQKMSSLQRAILPPQV
jgi:hypothetical protein